MLPGLLQIIRLRRLAARNKPLRPAFLLSFVLGIDEPGDGKHHRADEIDEQIFHGVNNADIQIAAKTQALSVYHNVLNPLDPCHVIRPGRIQHHAVNGVDDSVFLHIQMEETVHAKLKKLPQNTDGHGEAEGHQRQIKRREFECQPVVVIQQNNQGKSNCRRQKTIKRMEHGIPVRYHHVKSIDFSQNFRRKNKTQNGDFQRRRQFDAQPYLQPAWNVKQQQRQQTKESALVASQHDLANQAHQHQRPQDVEHHKGTFMLPKLLFQRLFELLLDLFFLMFVFLSHTSTSSLRIQIITTPSLTSACFICQFIDKVIYFHRYALQAESKENFRKMDFALIISIIEYVVMALFAYQFVYIFIALIKKPKNYEAKTLHRYAFLVMARNEEAVIGNLIRSIRNLDYPDRLYKIFVVADNCTDRTAKVALKAGATVYKRFDDKRSGKGYAMRWLIEQIDRDYSLDSFDGYLVFDADNLLDKNYLKEMNRLFDNGFDIITSYRSSKNYGSNWISACTGLWFIKEAKLLNLPRFKCGLSCTVSGTGYLMSKEVVRSIDGWKYFLLTEDMEFSIDTITRGKKIAYCDSAVFYDEQPLTFRDSWNQRLRWTKGFYQVLNRYGGKLFSMMFRKPSFTYYDQLIILSPGYLFLTCAALIGLFTGFLTNFAQPDYLLKLFSTILGAAVGAYLMFFLLGLITTIWEWKRIYATSFRKILYLFTFPVFIFTYVPLSILALFSRVKWKKIHHTVNIDNEQMQNNNY